VVLVCVDWCAKLDVFCPLWQFCTASGWDGAPLLGVIWGVFAHFWGEEKCNDFNARFWVVVEE